MVNMRDSYLHDKINVLSHHNEKEVKKKTKYNKTHIELIVDVEGLTWCKVVSRWTGNENRMI